VTDDVVAEMEEVASQLEAVQAEQRRREEADSARQTRRQEVARRVLGGDEDSGDGEPAGEPGEPVAAEAEVEPLTVAVREGIAEGMTRVFEAAGIRVDEAARKGATTLAEARRHAPATEVPDRHLAIAAAAGISGYAHGDQLGNLEGLCDAIYKRARVMGVSHVEGAREYDAYPSAMIASAEVDGEHTLNVRGELANPGDVDALVSGIVTRDRIESLVAGGGWCAPSEVRYDFFEVECSDGLIDLPSTRINRGGIRYPTSPSLADANIGGVTTGFDVTTTPFLWSETDDIATVTGAPNKPCVRVPCPSYNERRLELAGVCVTAGNLATDAFPEMTARYLRMLNAAYDHARNGRSIGQMVALSSAIVSGGEFVAAGAGNAPVFQQVFGGAALAAADYRARLVMCDDDVLEVVFPMWVREAIRSDLAWRTGADPALLSASSAMIDGFFTSRRIRPQFVRDWQERAVGLPGASAPITAWPSEVTFLVYAPGTFLAGTGMTLDLGVIRDSVLNSENDYTAAFMESASLVALIGNLSRQYRVALNVNGFTGGGNAPTAAPGTNL
jgi:hypothetical protein